MINERFWTGRRVLITGHTGFKGSWLTLWLNKLGAKITGIALPPPTVPNLFDEVHIYDEIKSHICDIRHMKELFPSVSQAEPEVVFHLAAQSLVRASYRDPLTTFETNIMGIANLLESLRKIKSVRVAIVVTTDKVYRNNEWPYPYRENDPLGGFDPYSASKAASEIVIESYRLSFLASQGVALASARAGNVIGGGDWAEDRLIPDAIRAWQSNQPLKVRNPEAIRPWQHVLEPLAGYILLAQKLWDKPELAGPYNFGPATEEAAKVREVVEIARRSYEKAEVTYGEEADTSAHEAGWLALETAKSRIVLGLRQRWRLPEAIERTMHWYKAYYDGKDARSLCLSDIESYEESF
ncbi:MAG TPA: CDP-glucose 4,6-dehydratase [Syntrophales bacterium]|nr:CDP-glucose 4,6-dehydratase [Syntrophales bacterium]HPO36127.1 CDP-glucose 4,6-dehydratase [Syntrophales bacterium]